MVLGISIIEVDMFRGCQSKVLGFDFGGEGSEHDVKIP